MTEAAKVTAESVNLGKILEKIAPSFNGFGYPTRDCRLMLEPIDYVIFSGLSQNAVIEAITFLDVKSGNARLTAKQRDIANAVENGHVECETI
jgi:predicted Holliday junction resolvase-like endonuclease